MESSSGRSEETLSFTIASEEVGTRLDSYLSTRLDISRSHLKKMFDSELIWVNSHFEKKSYRLENNDTVVCKVTSAPQVDLEPREVDFEVLHEEEEWLLINKPSDLSVHPAPGQNMTTLVHGLLHRYPEFHREEGDLRPGIVHRLDRFTSGLLLVAKTNKAHKNLTSQFADRTVKKEYFAITDGVIEYDENLIKAPITRHNKQRERMMTNDSGKNAETLVVVEKRFKRHTAVNCFPKTGRRHQIRVHLNHLGHPIVGDGSYGAKVPVTYSSLIGRPPSSSEKTVIPRLCLHARSLDFLDPITSEPRHFSCKLPDDIQILLKALEEL